MSKRPYRIRNERTGKTWAFASSDAAINRLALLDGIPEELLSDFVYIEDGVRYPMAGKNGGLITTLRTIRRIYDLGTILGSAT